MSDGTESFSPKAIRFAEAGVVTMQADGLLDGAQSSAWESWRNGAPPRPGADGKVPVRQPLVDLFRQALRREAARLEASLAHHDDPDDANDLLAIRAYLTA